MMKLDISAATEVCLGYATVSFPPTWTMNCRACILIRKHGNVGIGQSSKLTTILNVCMPISGR